MTPTMELIIELTKALEAFAKTVLEDKGDALYAAYQLEDRIQILLCYMQEIQQEENNEKA